MIIDRTEKLRRYMLYVLCAAISLQRISMAAGNILLGLAILIALYLCFVKKFRSDVFEENAELKQACKVFTFFLLCLIPSVVFSPKIVFSFKNFCEMWIFRTIPFVIVLYFNYEKRLLEKILMIFLAVEGIDGLLSTLQVLSGFEDRGFGFGGQVLKLAAILSFVIPIVVVLSVDKQENSKTNFVSRIVLPCLLLATLTVKSRALWLITFSISPILLFSYLRKNKRYLGIYTGICLATILFFCTSTQYLNRIKSSVNFTTNVSNTDRIVLWKIAGAMVKDNPLNGVGLGNYDYFMHTDKYYRTELVQKQLNHTHNNYVQIAAEAGVPGLIGFLTLTFYLIFHNFYEWVKSKNPYALMLFGAWSGFSMFGMVDLSVDASAVIKTLWFLTGILFSLRLISTNAKENL